MLRSRGAAMHKALPKFDYDKYTPPEKTREKKPKRILDNGNDYEGEWY